jgi:hypothetical protein
MTVADEFQYFPAMSRNRLASAVFGSAYARSAAAAAIGHSSPLRILSLRAETSFLFRIA